MSQATALLLRAFPVLRSLPHWCRVVMDRDILAELEALPLGEFDAVEVSGQRRSGHGFRSYRATAFPEFDLCGDEPIEPSADLVFCEQVLEHVVDPARATRNLRALLRPGGRAFVSVPFLLRVHREPEDYWRFSPAGLRVLLENGGFEVERIASWGNRAAVVGNLWFWFPYVPFLNPLSHNETTPLVVWAIARKPS